jgi:transcriptional regulator with XRE-family HTH domain
MNLQEVHSLEGPARGFLDLEGQQPRRTRRSIQNLRQMGPAYAKASGQVGDRFLEGVRMPCHEISVVCDTIKSRGNEIDPVSIPIDSIGMTTWPQRPVIQRAVLAYRKEHKLSPEQMAEVLGVGPSYLHNVLYDKRVWPSLEIAQKLSEVLGLKLGEVVDDPGGEIEGVAREDFAELSPTKRAVLNMVFQRLKAEEVTDDQAMGYLRILDAAVEAGIVRKPVWKK